MKQLTSTLIILFLVGAASTAVLAQGSDNWVKVSPPNERFTVQMPQSPAQRTQKDSYNDLNVDGRIYTAVDGDVIYTVWSLKNTNYLSFQSRETTDYLDACADLVWESFLKPLRDKLPKKPNIAAHMSYQGELTGKRFPGREYLIRLDKTEGIINFYVSNGNIYVLMVLNGSQDAPATERFLKSFGLDLIDPTLPGYDNGSKSTAAPSATGNVASGEGMGIGPGRSESTTGAGNVAGNRLPSTSFDSNDPNRVFSSREVTQKARILDRAEPVYTESARKYSVTGTIVLRAVFSKEGQLTNIKVMKGLPHGLTRQAVAAARRIKFIPAQKDGRTVSQYIQIEYNFNLY